MNKYLKICTLFLLTSILLSCSKDDEPDGGKDNKVVTELKSVVKQIPMEWGVSPATITEKMEKPEWSDYKRAYNSQGTLAYKSANTPYIIMYCFENSELTSVSVAFPRQKDFNHKDFFKNYEYLGYYYNGSEVYLDEGKAQIGFYSAYAVYTGVSLSSVNYISAE